MKVDVLGTKYMIQWVKASQDEYMEKMHFGGYCDGTSKKIVILDLKSVPNWEHENQDVIEKTEKCTLRHELVHAFLNESGLAWNSFTPEKAWAKNEEMVDWIAIQFPKILKAFQAVEAL